MPNIYNGEGQRIYVVVQFFSLLLDIVMYDNELEAKGRYNLNQE